MVIVSLRNRPKCLDTCSDVLERYGAVIKGERAFSLSLNYVKYRVKQQLKNLYDTFCFFFMSVVWFFSYCICKYASRLVSEQANKVLLVVRVNFSLFNILNPEKMRISTFKYK